MTLTTENIIAILIFIGGLFVTAFKFFSGKLSNINEKITELTGRSARNKDSCYSNEKAINELEKKNDERFERFQKESNERYMELKEAMADLTLNLTNVINDSQKEILKEIRDKAS